jgi:hypothetical protein
LSNFSNSNCGVTELVVTRTYGAYSCCHIFLSKLYFIVFKVLIVFKYNNFIKVNILNSYLNYSLFLLIFCELKEWDVCTLAEKVYRNLRYHIKDHHHRGPKQHLFKLKITFANLLRKVLLLHRYFICLNLFLLIFAPKDYFVFLLFFELFFRRLV